MSYNKHYKCLCYIAYVYVEAVFKTSELMKLNFENNSDDLCSRIKIMKHKKREI